MAATEVVAVVEVGSEPAGEVDAGGGDDMIEQELSDTKLVAGWVLEDLEDSWVGDGAGRCSRDGDSDLDRGSNVILNPFHLVGIIHQRLTFWNGGSIKYDVSN
jgi:hypothetical protein